MILSGEAHYLPNIIIFDYESTTGQYLDNIMVIANYKSMVIITWVLQKESRRKAQAHGQGTSLNKFFTVKNLLCQKCTKCGKMNHTTHKITGPGGNVQTRAKGLGPKRHQDPEEAKRTWKKRGKAKKCTNKCQCIRNCRLKWIVNN